MVCSPWSHAPSSRRRTRPRSHDHCPPPRQTQPDVPGLGRAADRFDPAPSPSGGMPCGSECNSALAGCGKRQIQYHEQRTWSGGDRNILWFIRVFPQRSEEHTSELQSHSDLVCRLLLEKKKKKKKTTTLMNKKDQKTTKRNK